MEVLKGYTKTLRSPVSPTVANVTAQAFDSSGTAIGAPANATVERGVASFDLPYPAIVNEGEYYVNFSFVENGTRYDNKIAYTVVTPYLDVWELEDILGEDFDGDIWAVESGVRQVINAHCGQSFGKEKKSVYVTGSGDSFLNLPQRMIQLESLDINGASEYRLHNDPGPSPLYSRFETTGDGWVLRRPKWLYYSIKADTAIINSNGAIRAPQIGRQTFDRGARYLLGGTWGYERVPEGVREAMKLLVNDYACSEIAYRDRYLEAITSADWRLQFNTGAYRRTGNARADHLLAPYVRSKMLIV